MANQGGSQKILCYIMGSDDPSGSAHKFLTLRRTRKNGKGRWATAEQFYSLGLLWPTSVAKDRDELARTLGQAILDEAGV